MSELFKAFLRHENAIRRVVGRYFSRREDVEDLVQETFLKCFAAETKVHIRDPKAFLLRAAKNTAISEIKKKSRTMTDYLEESGTTEVLKYETQSSIEKRCDEQEKLTILTKVVAGLPSDARRAFLLRKMDGMKYRQIALRMDLPLTTVHRLIARAVTRCSETLREQGHDLSEFNLPQSGVSEDAPLRESLEGRE